MACDGCGGAVMERGWLSGLHSSWQIWWVSVLVLLLREGDAGGDREFVAD